MSEWGGAGRPPGRPSRLISCGPMLLAKHNIIVCVCVCALFKYTDTLWLLLWSNPIKLVRRRLPLTEDMESWRIPRIIRTFWKVVIGFNNNSCYLPTPPAPIIKFPYCPCECELPFLICQLVSNLIIMSNQLTKNRTRRGRERIRKIRYTKLIKIKLL